MFAKPCNLPLCYASNCSASLQHKSINDNYHLPAEKRFAARNCLHVRTQDAEREKSHYGFWHWSFTYISVFFAAPDRSAVRRRENGPPRCREDEAEPDQEPRCRPPGGGRQPAQETMGVLLHAGKQQKTTRFYLILLCHSFSLSLT